MMGSWVLVVIWWVISVVVRILLVQSLFTGCLIYFSWLFQPKQFDIDPKSPVLFMKRLMILAILLYVFHFILPT